ncbi:MAG TPA: SlyX family protein [Pseudomonadales bacterium]
MVAQFDDSNTVQKQIIELQSKLAFQEDTVQSLNDIVSEQQQDILSLKGQMRTLLEELKNVLGDLDGDGASRLLENERPPHY